MIAAWNDRTICDLEQSVEIGDKHFELVKEFEYLGSLMTPNIDVGVRVLFQTAQTSVPPFTPDEIRHSQDLHPPSPALRQ
jgi:hypothetical protein